LTSQFILLRGKLPPQFKLNVIPPEGHASLRLSDKIRIAPVMAGADGAGGQGHLTAWRVASATCPNRAGFKNSIQLEVLLRPLWR